MKQFFPQDKIERLIGLLYNENEFKLIACLSGFHSVPVPVFWRCIFLSCSLISLSSGGTWLPSSVIGFTKSPTTFGKESDNSFDFGSVYGPGSPPYTGYVHIKY